LLSKEQAVLFPFVFAVDVWLKTGKRPWDKPVKATFVAMAVAVAAYVVLRGVVLARPFHGGFDYFGDSGFLVRLLTVSRFWVVHYLFPMATGLALQADFARPFLPDASPWEGPGWLCLAFWSGLVAVSVRGTLSRTPLALWACVFFIPLLPTSHLLIHLDTIGAERFLYMPSIAFCVLAAMGLARLGAPARNAALALLLAAYSGLTVRRTLDWRDEKSYLEAALRANPVSAGAVSGLGVVLIQEGRLREARAAFEKAAGLNPRHPAPHYNLGRLELEAGNGAEAEKHAAKALGLYADDPDAWVLRGNAAALQHKGREAAEAYLRALELRPWDPAARYNLGRLLMASGRPAEAASQFEEYLLLAPGAPDEEETRRLAAELRAAAKGGGRGL